MNRISFLNVFQVLDVYNIKNDVPLFFIMYRELRPTKGQVLSTIISLSQTDDDPTVVNMSYLEHHAMLKLFHHNASRLHSKHQESDKVTKPHFQASFVLPLCPIGMRNLGSLTKDSGCELCGKKNISRCAQCLAVSYCSRGKFFKFIRSSRILPYHLSTPQNVRKRIGKTTKQPAVRSKEVLGVQSQ